MLQANLFAQLQQSASGDPEPTRAPTGVRISREELVGWINQLASPEFEIRDKATGRLNQLDPSMVPEMKAELAKSTDLEVRVRLSAAISKIDTEYRIQVKQAFLRDPNPEHTHGFEGWRSFSQVAGLNRSSKRLFLKLIDNHPALVTKKLEASQDAMQAAHEVAAKMAESVRAFKEFPEEDAIALLYCLTAAGPKRDRQLDALSFAALSRGPGRLSLLDIYTRKPMEQMILSWSQPTEHLRGNVIIFLLEANIASARLLAAQILAETKDTNEDAEDVSIALQAMYRFGTKDDLPLVEKWIDSTSVITSDVLPVRAMISAKSPSNPNEQAKVVEHTVEIRDEALLVAMQISGVNFRPWYPGTRLHPIRGYMIWGVPVDDPKIRNERLEFWQSRKNQEK